MNEKFFHLPIEKQQRILSAGYRIFSHNSYRKSPVGEIAAEAGISKSLLFHYFHNKKDLYLYLLKKGGDITIQALEQSGCLEEPDRFKAMALAMETKIKLMHTQPDLSTFMIRAYFEKDPEIREDIKAYIDSYEHLRTDRFFQSEEKEFRPNISMMYKTMQLTVEGFLFEKLFRDDLDPHKLEKEFSSIIRYWTSLYGSNEQPLRRGSKEVQKEASEGEQKNFQKN